MNNGQMDGTSDWEAVLGGIRDLGDILENVGHRVEMAGVELTSMFQLLTDHVRSVTVELDGMSQAINAVVGSMSAMASDQQNGVGAIGWVAAGAAAILGIPNAIGQLEKLGAEISKVCEHRDKMKNGFELVSLMLPKTVDAVKDLGGVFRAIPGEISAAFAKIGSLFSGMSLGWGVAIAAVVAGAAILIANWDKVGTAMMQLWDEDLQPIADRIAASVESIGNLLVVLWNATLQPIIDWISEAVTPIISTVLIRLLEIIGAAAIGVGEILAGLMQAVEGVVESITAFFTGNQDMAVEGTAKVFIGLEGLLDGIVTGAINIAIGILNLLCDMMYMMIGWIVDWLLDKVNQVGGYFGLDWNLHLDPPQIPYLAQGAVLPANEPFMAVVGDQKHGTNVEAPLATIQEAVANVMADMLPAMVAGFEAVVTEQRALRGAVEELEIGDQVIGQAAQRYAQRMAVIRGGAV